MAIKELHDAQFSILQTLRLHPQASYTELRRPTGIESDNFKFHLRKLLKLGYVEKLSSGHYRLTLTGKIFVYSLHETAPIRKMQPRLSVLLLVSRIAGDKKLYLVQERTRQPFYGFCGFLVGPLLWGDEFSAAAATELNKQTGLSGTFRLRGFYRRRNSSTVDNSVFGDSFFIVMEASDPDGNLMETWEGGRNYWITSDQLKQLPKYFDSDLDVLDMLKKGESYRSGTPHYGPDELELLKSWSDPFSTGTKL